MERNIDFGPYKFQKYFHDDYSKGKLNENCKQVNSEAVGEKSKNVNNSSEAKVFDELTTDIPPLSPKIDSFSISKGPNRKCKKIIDIRKTLDIIQKHLSPFQERKCDLNKKSFNREESRNSKNNCGNEDSFNKCKKIMKKGIFSRKKSLMSNEEMSFQLKNDITLFNCHPYSKEKSSWETDYVEKQNFTAVHNQLNISTCNSWDDSRSPKRFYNLESQSDQNRSSLKSLEGNSTSSKSGCWTVSSISSMSSNSDTYETRKRKSTGLPSNNKNVSGVILAESSAQNEERADKKRRTEEYESPSTYLRSVSLDLSHSFYSKTESPMDSQKPDKYNYKKESPLNDNSQISICSSLFSSSSKNWNTSLPTGSDEILGEGKTPSPSTTNLFRKFIDFQPFNGYKMKRRFLNFKELCRFNVAKNFDTIYNKIDERLIGKHDKWIHSSKKKVFILGDSHTRFLVNGMEQILPGFRIYTFCKPSATTEQVLTGVDESIHELTKHDFLVLLCGTNDMWSDSTDNAQRIMFRKLKSFSNTNILVCNVPTNYSESYQSPVQNNIASYNKFLKETVNNFSYTFLVQLNKLKDKRFFTKHGLHFNATGKVKICELLSHRLVDVLDEINL